MGARTASALTIIPTWDSTINNDPNAAAIKASITTALGVYQAKFANNVTVNITFAGMQTRWLGQSQTEYTTTTYSQLLTVAECQQGFRRRHHCAGPSGRPGRFQ